MQTPVVTVGGLRKIKAIDTTYNGQKIVPDLKLDGLFFLTGCLVDAIPIGGL